MYDVLILIYLSAAIGLTPDGSSTVHIYTQTIHRTTQLTLFGRLSGVRTQSVQTNWEECRPCPVFANYTLALRLTTEEKAQKNLSQGSRRVPVGTMNTEYTEQNIHIKNTINISIKIRNKPKYTKHTTIYKMIKEKNQ
jgi:hypothetical protein